MQFYGDWPNPIMRRSRDGKIPPRGAKPRVGELKIPYESRKTHVHSCASHNFPTSGLAGVVEKQSTTSGEATSGGLFLPPQLLSHEWGKCDEHRNGHVSWVTNRGFYPVPTPPHDGIYIPILQKWKLLHNCKNMTLFSIYMGLEIPYSSQLYGIRNSLWLLNMKYWKFI